MLLDTLGSMPVVTVVVAILVGVGLHFVSWWLHHRWLQVLVYGGGLVMAVWLVLLVWVSMNAAAFELGALAISILGIALLATALITGVLFAGVTRGAVPWQRSLLAGWSHAALMFGTIEVLAQGITPPLVPLTLRLDDSILVPAVGLTFMVLLILRRWLMKDEGWRAPVQGMKQV